MTIGFNDVIDLLELNLTNVVAKMENQSQFSTLNCHSIEEVLTESGKQLQIELLHSASGLPVSQKILFANFTRTVDFESGTEITEYTIETTVVIFDQLFLIDLVLVDAHYSDHLLVIGSEFMSDKFKVDFNLSNLSYNLKSQLRI